MLYEQLDFCVCVNGMKIKSFNVSVGLRQDCVLPSSSVHYIHGQDSQDTSSSNGATFEECYVRRLLFADDFVLLNSNKSDFQFALDRFSDACLDTGMKLSRAKTDIMCLARHLVMCSFQTSGVTLQKTEKLDLGITLY